MKKILLCCSLLIPLLAFSQNAMNVTELSNFDVDTIPTHSFGTFNDVWGYVDANDREYAIMGSAAYIHFFDVTDPTSPVEIAAIPGGSTTVWRDFKTYGDRVYASADNSGEGLIIFDVSTLPDTVSVVYQNTEFFTNAHNIFIDEANGRLYAAGTDVQSSGLVVLDIASNPDQPALLSSVNLFAGILGGYVHDLYVRDNMAYCSHGNSSALIIWDFTDASNPEYIASYESQGYNHSNWVSEDGNTLVFAEEVPTGLPMGILDITDRENDNLDLYGYYKFPLLAPQHEGATPHNPYILGDYVYTSYYEDGIQIWDISDPGNPVVAGYFDTYPENTSYNGYRGCWGVYPFLPSGNLLVSDMTHGLFLMETDLTPVVNTEELTNDNRFITFPNPVLDELSIELSIGTPQEVQFSLFDLNGKLKRSFEQEVSGEEVVRMNLSDLPAGIYLLEVRFGAGTTSEKIIKH